MYELYFQKHWLYTQSSFWFSIWVACRTFALQLLEWNFPITSFLRKEVEYWDHKSKLLSDFLTLSKFQPQLTDAWPVKSLTGGWEEFGAITAREGFSFLTTTTIPFESRNTVSLAKLFDTHSAMFPEVAWGCPSMLCLRRAVESAENTSS